MESRPAGHLRRSRRADYAVHPLRTMDVPAVEALLTARDAGRHGASPSPRELCPDGDRRLDQVVRSAGRITGVAALRRVEWTGEWPLQPWDRLEGSLRTDADAPDGRTAQVLWIGWRGDESGRLRRFLYRHAVLETCRRASFERALHRIEVHPDLGPGTDPGPEAYLQQLHFGGVTHPVVTPLLEAGFRLGGYRLVDEETVRAVLYWER